jgi:hypothetical protein
MLFVLRSHACCGAAVRREQDDRSVKLQTNYPLEHDWQQQQQRVTQQQRPQHV